MYKGLIKVTHNVFTSLRVTTEFVDVRFSVFV